MTKEEAKKMGATHYMDCTIDLGFNCITYFKLKDGKFYEYFANHFARYETGVNVELIKPL